MRMTSFFLLALCLQVSARSFSQRVTVSLKQAPLAKVFDEIFKQTGKSVIYKEDLFKDAKPVTVEVTNEPLKDFLDLCFKGQPFSYHIEGKTILITASLPPPHTLSPPAAISGVVKDEKGNPVEGASIFIRSLNRGVSTDKEGQFSFLEVPAGKYQLDISFMGYESVKLSVRSGQSDIVIHLVVNASSLNDMVVVGYGTQKKVDLTGAVDQVSGQVLENRPIVNTSQGLQGVIPGLNITTNYSAGGSPGAALNINIRGYTSLGSQTGTTTDGPLILVDGVPGDINAINPLDIESVSVLKDAASSAIYGSRAPYGVVLVTTKKGKKGKMQVSASSNVSRSQAINLPKMVSSVQFAQLYNEANDNSQAPHTFTDAVVQNMKNYIANPGSTPTTIPDPTQPNTYGGWFYANSNNDWFKVFFSNWADNQQHTLSLTGGEKNTTYYIGMGYQEKSGMYHFGHDAYNRYNLRANITTEATNWLTLNLRTAFSRSSWNTPDTYPAKTGGNYMHQIARKWPNLALLNPDGHYSYYNDIALQLYGGRDIENINDISLTGEAVVKPLPGWQIVGSYNVHYTIDDKQSAGSTVNAYYMDGTTFAQSPTPNSLSKYVDLTNYLNSSVYTSYEKRLGGHYFKALVGFQSELSQYKDLTGSNTYMYSPTLPALSLTYGTTPTLTDNLTNWGTEGVFMRFNYNFSDKYLLEFNGRYDGSSRFSPSNRWGFFPSVSAGYNVHREHFWAPIQPYVNTLKLRGSYGALGDNNVSNYLYLSTLQTISPTSSNWIFGGNAPLPYVSQASSLVSPNIGWAKPSMLDFGADMSFLKNRLSLTYDWYIRKNTNMIGPAQTYPAVLGAGAPIANNTSLETTGFELSLGWHDKIGKVNYTATAILSDYHGKVLSYPNPQGLLQLSANGNTTNWYKGEKIGEIWGYQTVGLFQTQDAVNNAPAQTKLYANWRPGDVQYMDLNHDGIISPGSNTLSNPGDQKVIGNSTPRYNYGLRVSVNWENFDLGFFIQGVAKRDFFTNSNYFFGIIGDGIYQSSPFVPNLNRWTSSTPNGYFPRYYLTSEMYKNTQVQTRYLQKAAYMRLKNAQIGYTLPRKWLDRIRLQQVRFYFSAENLFTRTKLEKSFDPEAAISDAKVYPLQRTFSTGLNISL